MPGCGMKRSTEAAWERAMKIQEVMLRAMAKRIAWWQAAEIIGSVVGRCGGGDYSMKKTDMTDYEIGDVVERRRSKLNVRRSPILTMIITCLQESIAMIIDGCMRSGTMRWSISSSPNIFAGFTSESL
jgi:hypothetical protein